MPKMKTKRAAAKRYKVTASGLVKCGHANVSHILTKKSRKRKRKLRTARVLAAADQAMARSLVPYK